MDKAEGRLDDHAKRIDHLERETTRTRRRLHDLETDRSSIRHMVEITKELTRKVNDAVDHVDVVADRAVEKVFKRRRDERRESWRYWIGWAAFVVMTAAFVVEHH